ncbi:MAG: hypothetical protein M1839_000742 [Geoglossum umbratile]|nr:MAG: hypothetical protein M1839_000742 [Geoglossum umbratile]
MARKRLASSSPTPAKRVKEETSSRYVPMPQGELITIDEDSDMEIGDQPLLSMERAAAEFDKLIEEARRRHKIQHGKREAAAEALALKHSLEERVEQDEMKRLHKLRALTASRLNGYLRESIVGSRMLPSRVTVNVTVPIKQEQKPPEYVNSNQEGNSEPPPVFTPPPSMPAASDTRVASLESPSDGSRITRARVHRRMTSRTSKLVKKEERDAGAEGDGFVYRQDSGNDSDPVNSRKINRLMDPNHIIWSMDTNGSEDGMDKSEASDGGGWVTGNASGGRTTANGANGRKRRLTEKELAAVPRIQMPEYILALMTDYYRKLPLPETSVKFSRRFLTRFLGGGEQGTYVNISQKRLQEEQVYPISSYYCFCPMYNPQVPPGAGRHGAGLAIGSDKISRDHDVGLQQRVNYFIKRRPTEWEYCGEYVQGRHYEKLRPDEVKIHVRDKTLQYWAEKVVSREWGARILVKYGAARDEAHAKTFTAEQVKRLFNKPDNAPGAKLRFYWQYMECCDYNLDLYEALSKKGLEIGWTTRPDLTKDNNFGVNAVMPTAVLDELENEPSDKSSDWE